jgi:hypothetical protein
MSPVVIALLGGLHCSLPPLDFRTFYSRFYASPGDRHWFVRDAEDRGTAARRLADALADFADYRAGRADKCRDGIMVPEDIP